MKKRNSADLSQTSYKEFEQQKHRVNDTKTQLFSVSSTINTTEDQCM
jgi:hypothetical protein